MLLGTDFLQGAEALIDWRRQQLTIGGKGGCREDIPLTPSHTSEKTDHLYCAFGGCRRQRRPLQLAASDTPPFTPLRARARQLQRARFPTVSTSDDQTESAPPPPSPSAKSKEDLARDLVEAYDRFDYKRAASKFGEIAANKTVLHLATTVSSDTKAAVPAETVEGPQDTEGQPELHMTNPADVLEPSAQVMHKANNLNWQVYPRVYAHYNGLLGPFTLDACADVHGRNAMHPTYWTAEQDCRRQDWARHNAWAHPPMHIIPEVLQQFLQCKERKPHETAETFLLPHQPSASWWATVRDNFSLTGYHAEGSDLFINTPTHEGKPRL